MWREIRAAVETSSALRAQAGHPWGTLGYMVAEDWSDAWTIANRTFGPDANPILHSAFDFPVRYAIVGVVGGEESGLSGRPASDISDTWAYGAHDNVYAEHALPNLMLGNHDLVRFGDLLQRADIADPNQAEYWARHRLAFLFQAAYSGPITRYYGEEIGDEVPNYADRVTNNCANLGLCDDHVARTSAKILGVTVTSQQLSTNQHDLMQFHEELMDVRSLYPALSHGDRQHIYSDDALYIDLKTHANQQIVFAMNTSDQTLNVQLHQSLFSSNPMQAWDVLGLSPISIAGDYVNFDLAPLSGSYILIDELPISPGDYNADHAVNAADYVVWRKGLGPSYTQDDYDEWRSYFGTTVGSGASAGGSAAVPEPAAARVILITAAFLTLFRYQF